MKTEDVRKILILDQGDPVANQMLAKAAAVFGGGADADGSPEFVLLKAHRTHNIVLRMMEETIREEMPQLVLIGATALGEEVAPALGVRFHTGVAAHCVDIRSGEEGEITFLIPAFGGRAIGEIFIPGAEAGRPAIATVKPGIFQEQDCVDARIKVIDLDAMTAEGSIPEGSRTQGSFQLTQIEPRRRTAGSIAGAGLIFCGGYGLGSEETWRKLETLAGKLGGAAACTRAALDAGWGCAQDTMIGTSGKAVSPEVYVGFGVSGAAHHTCGLARAGTIININSDKDADAFAVSDYKGVFDAEQVIDALLDQIK